MLKRLLIALPLAAAGAFWFFILILPWPVTLRWRDPRTTSLMRQRMDEANAAGRDYEIRQDWVPLRRISRHLQRAVIVAEDGKFYEHHGVDWHALATEFHYKGDDDFSPLDPGDLAALGGAFAYYLRHRAGIRGRSTITQQLAKNLYFSTDRSVLRKLEEFVVAKRLEWFLSKDRILEIYLNVVEWGPGVFGAQAAARKYFGRDAADLSTRQAAELAATLPHPLTANPDHHVGRMEWRVAMILRRMGGSGPVETVPLEDEPAAPEVRLLGEEAGDTAGTGTAGTDTAGTGTAGIDTAGTGTAGTDTAGTGTAGTDTAGAGTAAADTAGTGTAGTDTTGAGTAGADTTGGVPRDTTGSSSMQTGRL